ncbi:MAG: hypothetical protein MJ239_03965 [Bacilli bacterium]|nr:hypothetical protein [Bacilli bacterium]
MKTKHAYFYIGASALLLISCGGGSSSASSNSNPQSIPTSEESQVSSLDPSFYSATVMFPDGTPVSGVDVMWCTSSQCFMPIRTDENGTSVNEAIGDNQYYVHISRIPEGYTYNPNIYTPNEEDRHVDIFLEPLSIATLEKEGLPAGSDNRYIYESDKAYEVTLEEEGDIIFFGFNAEASGKYEIESWAVDKQSTNPTNPKFLYYGDDPTAIPTSPIEEKDDGGIGDNFKYALNALEGKSYTFAIIGSATRYPATFTVKVSTTVE